ncbi:MAG: hypothetical protein JWM81_280 [Candidatus Saccharibacteria bacterium]|nr:hypothetical protein [Candidatus Saccharibacteria bacterium]
MNHPEFDPQHILAWASADDAYQTLVECGHTEEVAQRLATGIRADRVERVRQALQMAIASKQAELVDTGFYPFSLVYSYGPHFISSGITQIAYQEVATRTNHVGRAAKNLHERMTSYGPGGTKYDADYNPSLSAEDASAVSVQPHGITFRKDPSSLTQTELAPLYKTSDVGDAAISAIPLIADYIVERALPS